MAFLIPKKPPSLSSTPSSYEDDEPPVPQSTVTSHLYIKPDASGTAADRRSLSKDVVLRRIRHRKRVNRIRGALQSVLRGSPDPGEKGPDADGAWFHDAFSSP